MLLALVLLVACSPDTTFVARQDGNRPGLSAPDDTLPADTGQDTGQADTADTAASDTSVPDTSVPDTAEPDPAPSPGDLVINELMIDPAAVPDSRGEWVELLVTSATPVDLTGLVLADDDVDACTIEPVAGGAFVFDPGDTVVLCTDPDDNGGADCDGTYLYQGFGGGFALANAGDEVILRLADGSELDRVHYDDSIVDVGASAGLSPARASTSGNDDLGHWCSQRSRMSGGDAGTPGRANDGC